MVKNGGVQNGERFVFPRGWADFTMNQYPVYQEPLFRPPSEAHSAIVQATLGCSWNRCAFCSMYATKNYRVRPLEEVVRDLEVLARWMPSCRKLFLADGNAFALPFHTLKAIALEAHRVFPQLHRISAYSLARDILAKGEQELQELRELGISLLYIGVETGDAVLLKAICKPETPVSYREAFSKAHGAGISTSAMIITGLGGRLFSEAHARHSAELISELQPKFLSTLSLFLPEGEKVYAARFKGDYQPQTVLELMGETRTFMEGLRLNTTIFRSNHISNSLPLEGTLSKDQPRLLAEIDAAIIQEEQSPSGRLSGEAGY